MKEFDNLWVIDRGLMKGLDNLGTIVKAFRNVRIVVKGFGEKIGQPWDHTQLKDLMKGFDRPWGCMLNHKTPIHDSSLHFSIDRHFVTLSYCQVALLCSLSLMIWNQLQTISSNASTQLLRTPHLLLFCSLGFGVGWGHCGG